MRSPTGRRQSQPCDQDEFRVIPEYPCLPCPRDDGVAPSPARRTKGLPDGPCSSAVPAQDKRPARGAARANRSGTPDRRVDQGAPGRRADQARLPLLAGVEAQETGTGVPPSFANRRGVCGAACTVALTGTSGSRPADFPAAVLAAAPDLAPLA